MIWQPRTQPRTCVQRAHIPNLSCRRGSAAGCRGDHAMQLGDSGTRRSGLHRLKFSTTAPETNKMRSRHTVWRKIRTSVLLVLAEHVDEHVDAVPLLWRNTRHRVLRLILMSSFPHAEQFLFPKVQKVYCKADGRARENDKGERTSHPHLCSQASGLKFEACCSGQLF